MRIGEALGLRHEDWAAAERTVTVVARVNDNGARAKSVQPRSIPVAAGLVRLYADYLHGEYGDLDSDYVFVNLWAGLLGHPLTYAAVYDLVGRLRRRTGIDFDPHWCRHTYVISPGLNLVRDVGHGGGRARASRVSGTRLCRWLPSPRDRVDQRRVPGRAGGVAARRRRVVGGARR